MFKINVDGATTDDGRRSSVEVVIRECRGIMVAARGVLLNASYDVETRLLKLLQLRLGFFWLLN